MIEYIKGEIVDLTPARMILECAGIGYELNISLNTYTFYNGKPTGKIYVYEPIRARKLEGFATDFPVTVITRSNNGLFFCTAS